MEQNRKKVFISYSWDGPEHEQWVLKLGSDLVSKFGIDIILDQFELSAGKDLTHFMENSIAIADKVLVILTPNYKIKAENREKGVGYETSMISKEIFESPISTVKFIPILRKGTSKDSSPKFLSSKIYLEMTDDSKYVNKAYELFQAIYDKSIATKPEFGPIPNENNLDNYDPILEMAKNVIEEDRLNKDLNNIIESSEGVRIFLTETDKLKKQLKDKAEFYTTNLDLGFTHEIYDTKACISGGHNSVVFNWKYNYSNTAKYARLTVTYFKEFISLNSNYYYHEEPKRIKFNEFVFDLDYEKNVVWREKNLTDTTDEIIQKSFLFIVERIIEEKKKDFRK